MSRRAVPTSIALIGYGAIADEIVRTLAAASELRILRGDLVRPPARATALERSLGRFAVVSDMAGLLNLEADVIIEVAGHAAVGQLAPPLLARGRSLLVSSVGAFADRALARRVVAAGASGASLLVAPGAVAGIDGLRAARTAGLKSVAYTSWKPPAAWRGTRGATRVDRLGGEAGVFFEGTAREAALDYPQNANVGATIGLLGLGLDHTAVRLGSDPALSGPKGVIEAEGEFGAFRFEIDTRPSANPKTSSITAHSLLAAVRDETGIDLLDAVQASLA